MSDLGLPRAERPEEIGLSSERLDRINATLRHDVERRLIPGAVLAIARGGRVGYAEAVGFRDREAQAPLAFDAIFRVASMTKPVVSVAAMMLAEEGRLDISAPVADYIPAFGAMTVGVDRRPAQRVMTVQDLMRHTSGLTYAQFGDSPVQMIWRDAKLMDDAQTNADLVGKLARLPLMSEPGTTWEYSMSTDVLGRVVEVVAGQTLAEFFAERITGPLGMVDTGFAATGKRAARLAEMATDPATGKRMPMPYSEAASGRRWHSGGGGLVSSAADYLRFCQMLLNGGEFAAERLLSPKTVAHMTADHLPPDVAYGPSAGAMIGTGAPLPEFGQGFGLGFAVRKAVGMSPLPGSVGDYSWGGLYGTSFWVDPAEQMIVVLMLQAPEQRTHYRQLIRHLVYAALTRRSGRGYR
jgi:CubicO group peptidase (beta-lactamase class C family)